VGSSRHAPPFYQRVHIPALGGDVDATAAVHAARDTGAAELRFGPGTHRVTGLTASVAGQRWTLDPAAVLLLAAGATVDVVHVTADSVTIDGGTIDGNRSAQSSSSARGVRAVGVTGFTLRDTQITECLGRGLHLENVTDAAVIGNTIRGTATLNANDAQIWVYYSAGSSAGLTIRGNWLDGSPYGNGGIKLSALGVGNSISRVRISDNQIIVGDGGVGVDTLGIELWTSTSGVIEDAVIAGNLVLGENTTNTRIYGISVAGAATSSTTGTYGVAVLGNVIRDCRVMGIELLGSYNVAAGNVLRSSGPITLNSVNHVGGGRGCAIVGNVIHDAVASYAIELRGSATDPIIGAVVVGNAIYNPSSVAIYVVTGLLEATLIASNTVVSSGNAGVIVAATTASRVLVSSNVLDLTGSSATSDGIHIASTLAGLTVEGNMVYAAGRYGIVGNAVCDGLVLRGNHVIGAASDGIRTNVASCANWTIVDNEVTGCTGTGIILASSPLNFLVKGNRARGNTAGQINYGAATLTALDANGNAVT